MIMRNISLRDGSNAKFIRKLRCFFQVNFTPRKTTLNPQHFFQDKGREFGSLSVLSGLNTDLCAPSHF